MVRGGFDVFDSQPWQVIITNEAPPQTDEACLGGWQ
jgi:hypothetical protein